MEQIKHQNLMNIDKLSNGTWDFIDLLYYQLIHSILQWIFAKLIHFTWDYFPYLQLFIMFIVKVTKNTAELNPKNNFNEHTYWVIGKNINYLIVHNIIITSWNLTKHIQIFIIETKLFSR